MSTEIVNLEAEKHAKRLAVALNKRVPTLKCANGAWGTRDGLVILPPELAERVLRVLDGDESAACRIPPWSTDEIAAKR